MAWWVGMRIAGETSLLKPIENCYLSMKIHEIMSRDPYVCDPETPLSDVAAKMRDLEVGIIPVCNGLRLQGTLTDRDLVVGAVAEGLDPSMTVAEEVMNTDVAYCYDDEDIVDASALMEENQIRQVVVLDREMHLVGILTRGDISTRSKGAQLVDVTLEDITEVLVDGSDIADDDIDDDFAVEVKRPSRTSGSFSR
jgi:CBS domain-containing protein